MATLTDRAIQQAAHHVFNQGQLYQKEFARALDVDGHFLFDAAGEEEQVDFDGQQRHLLKTRAVTLVHNHPSTSSLSIEDIVCASNFEITVIAVTEDGSIYTTTGFRQQPAITCRLAMAAYLGLQQVSARFGRPTPADFPKLNFLFSHFFNLMLKQAGWIDYECQLSPTAQAWLDQCPPFLVKDLSQIRQVLEASQAQLTTATL